MNLLLTSAGISNTSIHDVPVGRLGKPIVAVPQRHWTDGSRSDLSAFGERVREGGAALVVDARQSLGACSLGLGKAGKAQPDFLVTVGYKWLLGPYGIGYLYVAPKWRDGMPLEQSWLTRAGSEDFTRLVDYEKWGHAL